MNAHICACGYQAITADELLEHIGEMVIPLDDIAPDGRPHAEAARDERGALGSDPAGSRCVCGFVTDTTTALDHHLLSAFAEPDTLSPHGHTHG
jgi:hypothetical protein